MIVLPLTGGSRGEGVRATDTFEARAARTAHWYARLSGALIALRSHFDGDLDLLVIYLIFAAAAKPARRGHAVQSRGINALSIADISSIPRETVRRKLRRLAALGYLRLEDDGLWYCVEAEAVAGINFFLDRLRSTDDSALPVLERPEIKPARQRRDKRRAIAR
ncbi:hypothetical protein [Sphingomonas sp.]|uniref:hypothetical protein n=1 Tax=Sphingomonas sp. TaxID=28214 RepID=UPI0035C7AD2D